MPTQYILSWICCWWMDDIFPALWTFTLPKTNSSPLKIGRNPIGNHCIPTIHFQVQFVSFKEGTGWTLCMALVLVSELFRGRLTFNRGIEGSRVFSAATPNREASTNIAWATLPVPSGVGCRGWVLDRLEDWPKKHGSIHRIHVWHRRSIPTTEP